MRIRGSATAEIFWNSDKNAYTVHYHENGAWLDSDGSCCDLVQVNALGDEVGQVDASGAPGPGEKEAIQHFELEPR